MKTKDEQIKKVIKSINKDIDRLDALQDGKGPKHKQFEHIIYQMIKTKDALRRQMGERTVITASSISINL